MKVSIIGRGTYYRLIVRDANPDVMLLNRRADVLYNWGLAGERYNAFFRKRPRYRNYPVLNEPINNSKWTQLCKVKKEGVPVLESSRDLSVGYLFKPDFSLGGRHIQIIDEEFYPPVAGYCQKFIPGEDRRYELRVHACSWREEEDYLVQKRVSDNPKSVTWNHHTGGRFITVNKPREGRVFRDAQAYSKRVLACLGLHHGGVDFLVTNDNNSIYFLEVNISIGLRLPATLGYWVDCFNLLTEGEING